MGVYFPDDEFYPDIPDKNEALWRYIDFTQFISLIETGELWFSAASVFTDKWEGGLTAKQVKRISKNIPSFVKDNFGSVRQLYDALRATTYVSCWHYRDEETAAMWELYNDRGKEIAIKTTVGELQKAIRWSDDMVMGCVEYKNYDESADLFPITRESPFFHKRSSFKSEQEFRIVKGEFNLPERASVNDSLKELVADKGGPGRNISVNPDTLIEEVVVSPVAGGWLKGLVEKVLNTYEMDDIDISDSKLGSDPFSAEE